jgi:hypothetical protein
VVKERQPVSEKGRESSVSDNSSWLLRAGTRGWNYQQVFGKFAAGAIIVEVLQPHLKEVYQQVLFVELMKFLATISTVQTVRLISREEDRESVEALSASWCQEFATRFGLRLEVFFQEGAHDRRLHFIGAENTWIVSTGRGIDFFSRPRKQPLKGQTSVLVESSILGSMAALSQDAAL